MNPDWVAMDLFSQAEHDEDAQPIVTTAQTKCPPKPTKSLITPRPSYTAGVFISTFNFSSYSTTYDHPIIFSNSISTTKVTMH